MQDGLPLWGRYCMRDDGGCEGLQTIRRQGRRPPAPAFYVSDDVKAAIAFAIVMILLFVFWGE